MDSKVAIVLDSTHYLPREVVAEHGLHEVSLYVTQGGVTKRELDITDFDEFYRELAENGTTTTTSQPSVGDFLSVYEPLLDADHSVLSIHLGAGISGTFASAQQARSEMIAKGVGEDRIIVHDSQTAALPLGLLGIAAANAVRNGATAVQAGEAAMRLRQNLKMWFAVDTLEYLRRGGRIGPAKALLGSALKIKPILTMEEKVTPVERVRTTKRAFARILELLRERREEGCDVWFVQHIRAHEQAAELSQAGYDIFGSEPRIISEVGPVIGAHTGPGLFGATATSGQLLDQPLKLSGEQVHSPSP